MDKKVKVTHLVSSIVVINLPESRLQRTWEKKGAVKTIPFDVLEEAMYDPGTESLFRDGVLGIDDMEVKIALGLEEEGTTEPTQVITLNDAQRKRYLTVMPLDEFKSKIKELSPEQIEELANFAIANEITNYDKSEVLKKITGKDIIKTVELNRKDKEAKEAKGE